MVRSPLAGFATRWAFLFLFVIIGLVASYLIVQRSRHRRVLRFASTELLDSVAPQRPKPWRHLPAVLVVIALRILTVALAGPTTESRIPRSRAIVMLVIDVSRSMAATDVRPSRMAAAQAAAEKFAGELTPGINVGLIAFAGDPMLLDSPTTNHTTTKVAINKMQIADRTATGRAIFTALQAIATVGAVIGGGNTPPPARIVLFSDGKETVPADPNNPNGAYTAARSAWDQGVPISTITFGTPNGTIIMKGSEVPVPVDGTAMKTVARLSAGTAYTASNLDQLNGAYAALQQQIGYESARRDASAAWLRLGALTLAVGAAAALLINRHLPI
jgi:Ca-activated chloride channel family protein